MAGLDFSTIDVLMIDDQDVIRGMVRGLLVRLGVRTVIQAASGTEGLQILSEKKPACVLCDINMNKMNGLEFLKEVRSGRSAAPFDLPIGMLTGHSDAEIVDTALALDSNAFILKPVSGAQLESRLGRILWRPMEFQTPATYAAIELPNLKVAQTPPVREPSQAVAGVRLTPPPSSNNNNIDSSNDRVLQKSLAQVTPGSVLGRDLRMANGKLLLAKGKPLSQSTLDRLTDLVDVHPSLKDIWVRI